MATDRLREVAEMGLFRDIGEKVERVKQEVESAAEDEADFVCTDCGKLIYTEHDQCPNCGSAALERRDPDDADADEPTDEGDAPN